MKYLLAALLLLAAPAAQAQPSFDSYMLALSWSPTYCASPGAAKREPMQCGVRRGFIVHGLWPEVQGHGVEACAPGQPRDVPADLKRKQYDMMPSPSLIEHEWDRHGACTGLPPASYFALMRKITISVMLPRALISPTAPMTTTAKQLKADILSVNRGMRADEVLIVCRKQQLEEVRICFTKAGARQSCGPAAKDSCPMGKITLPASAKSAAP